MSWPSMTIACQPNARQRRANCLGVVLPLRRAALAEAVDVGDGAQVVELVDGRDVGRFPDRAFGRLAVAEQHVGAVVGLDPARVQRDADGGADALAERSGGDVDERQPRRRVPFEIRVDPAQLQQLARDRTRRPRPRRRRESAPRGPSTARTDRCRRGCGSCGSNRISAKNSAATMSAADSSSSDGRCRLRTSTRSSRCGAGSRCSSRRESGRIDPLKIQIN